MSAKTIRRLVQMVDRFVFRLLFQRVKPEQSPVERRVTHEVERMRRAPR